MHTKLRHALRIDRALVFVWRASPFYAVLSGLTVLALGVVPLVSLYLIKLIIDSITNAIAVPGTGTAAGLSNPELSKPLLYIGLACGAGLLTAVFNFLGDYLKKAQAIAVSDHMFSVLHEKAAATDLAYYESPEYRDTLFRAQREGPYRPTSIVNGLFAAGQSGASFAAVFGLLFLFHPALSLVMVAAAVPGVILRLRYSEKIYAWQEKRTEDERRAYYFHWMLTGDAHAKEFRLFNLGRHFIERFRSIRQTLKQEKLYFEKRRALGDFIAQASATLAVFGAFVYIALKAVQGAITLGELVMYFQAFQKGLGFLKTFLETGAQMYEDNLFLSHVYDFLGLEPQVEEPRHPLLVPEKIRQGIEFENVAFSYQNNEKKVLNCVNFFLRPGEIVALVGENGSGKTTIVKLLTRLYDPTMGKILLDGQDIRNFSIDAFRKKFSVVFQDHIRYQLPAKENIFLGNVDRQHDFDKIKRSAVQADADETIQRLPLGYDTPLGRWFKNGEELSMGQWQMVAIARAFFRDADTVVLDEPSSALDPETEQTIFARLRELVRGRSALIISHRYATVKMADRILVLDQGRIIEQGSHQELMRLNGRYAKLYQTQAGSYLEP